MDRFLLKDATRTEVAADLRESGEGLFQGLKSVRENSIRESLDVQTEGAAAFRLLNSAKNIAAALAAGI